MAVRPSPLFPGGGAIVAENLSSLIVVSSSPSRPRDIGGRDTFFMRPLALMRGEFMRLTRRARRCFSHSLPFFLFRRRCELNFRDSPWYEIL